MVGDASALVGEVVNNFWNCMAKLPLVAFMSEGFGVTCPHVRNDYLLTNV